MASTGQMMQKWLERVAVALSLVLLLVYAGAKLHFYLRYDPHHNADYIAEHWPFWAGLIVVGLCILTLGFFARGRSK